ncbi:MAG: Fur family transcriptional regulator, partial [Longimicrobiales bacterium]
MQQDIRRLLLTLELRDGIPVPVEQIRAAVRHVAREAPVDLIEVATEVARGAVVPLSIIIVVSYQGGRLTFVHLFRRYLRDNGLPVTQQRESIAEVVFDSPRHLSVEEIEVKLRERGERIGKATIYRTLEMLVKSGLVEEHDFGEGFKRYEHLFGQQPVREHLVCTECGKVDEIHSSELVRVQEQEARRQGFL